MIDASAREFLQQSDAVIGRLIAQIGEIQPRQIDPHSDLLTELARAIIAQQISTQAARKIYERFLNLYAGSRSRSLTAAEILATPEDTFRTIGISRQKIRYLKDLALKIQSGLPTLAELESMEDEAIIKTLTEIKGVGRWTVQMLLIFRLQRRDVLPVDDLGVRKAIQKLYAFDQLPERKIVEQLGQQWKPYRSIAALYLWRSL